MSYVKLFNPFKTHQSEPVPGKDQVANNAGGYVFQIDKWARLNRFLILGSDSATYYQKARKLTRENAEIVLECWSEDPQRTAQTIGDISHSARAPKQAPAIFALALGANHADEPARQAAYAAVPRVCRTASHLFEWIDVCQKLGKGWGRGMKRVLTNWYEARDTDALAYQAIKYRSRSGFNHKRAIEVAHKGAGEDEARQALYLWARGKDVEADKLPVVVQAHLKAMKADNREALMQLVAEHRLPWEAIPTEALNDPGVWKAMLPHLGLTALIRNLGNMTACEAIKPMDCAEVVARLKNVEDLRKSRVHPFSVLQALAVYRSGHGVRGVKGWSPVSQVVDALDEAFYAAFANVEPTGKNILLALDVSGSMTSSMGGSPLSCREASAALALVTLATESNTQVVGFTATEGRYSRGAGLIVGFTATEVRYSPGADLKPLPLSARQRLDDAVETVSNLPFGRTDCALPMLYAAHNMIPVDAFVIYTDNETWAGKIHPFQALQEYRKTMGRDAKCIVVGMTSTGFSIADPGDGGMLDIVGFDGSCPQLISDFIRQ